MIGQERSRLEPTSGSFSHGVLYNAPSDSSFLRAHTPGRIGNQNVAIR